MSRAPSPGQLDWSDRIPPCVVLEVRRALRGRAFVGCFAGIQVMIAVSVYADFMDPASMNFLLGWIRDEPMAGARLFWVVAVVMLVVALPGTSLFALGSDIRRNTLELLTMTGVKSWDVVTAVWITKMLEGALILATLTPYVVLHYFSHGSNPLVEMALLGMVLVFAGSLSAVCITLSIIPNLLARFFAASLVVFVLVPVGTEFSRVFMWCFGLTLIGHSPAGFYETLFAAVVYAFILAVAGILLPLTAGSAAITKPRYAREDQPPARAEG